MKLTIHESLLTLGLLPVKGGYDILKACLELKKNIAFTEEETRKYDIRVVEQEKDGRQYINFNKEISEKYLREVKVPTVAKEYIKSKLVELSEAGELDEGQLSLYEKFVIK